jgi:SAM-dependent methyltransferase
MHESAIKNGEVFFATYSKYFKDSLVTVVDIGAQDVNGSLKEVCPKDFKYIGVDFQNGKGVDIVLSDPYTLPFENETIDIVVSSSCFEHSEMFWVSFLEILRVLKPTGIFYLNVPSDGEVHRYPVDCWRFYPDSGQALVTWAKRNSFNPTLLECYTQHGGQWYDYVAVFLKSNENKTRYNDRILHHKKDFENGMLVDNDYFFNPVSATQNERKISRSLSRRLKVIVKKLFLIELIRRLLKSTPSQS